MENKPSMSRVERLHREKVTRYSIRKYSFGAASVAVAALFMFLGNGAVSVQADQIQPGDTAAAQPATPTLDKTQLESYISEIETKLSNGSYDNKTEESVAVLKADLEAAKTTLANATTQAELKQAYSKLVTTANSKLRNKPVEKKETPAVDTTEGKETVGKSAENTEKKTESNSIENTGFNDARNGKEMDKENALRTETTKTLDSISYTMEFSNDSTKEIYLYNEEDANVNITVNSTAGKITKAGVKGGSGQFLNKSKKVDDPFEAEEIDGWGWTYHSILDATQGPAPVRVTGKPNEEFKKLPAYTKQESQHAGLGDRYLQVYDDAGAKIEKTSGKNALGYFRLVVKSQTYKYSIKLPESNADKIAVSNIDSLTEADIAKIKEKIKIQYSDIATTQDARLASHRGEVLADKNTVVAENGITVENGTVTVTYKDGSVDTTPVADVARTNEPPTVEIPYSDAANREIYVYGAEENSFNIKIKDDSDKVAKATLEQWGSNAFKPVDGETDKINTQYGYTANEFKTETPASDATPAVITYSGTPKAVDNLSQDRLDAATRGETPQGLALGWRYVAVTDVEGTKFAGSGKDAANDHAFRVMLKPQTQKYDVTTPAEESAKFPVVDANNVTDAEFKKIVGENNANIKLHYSAKNTDANLVTKQGQNVDDKADKIKSVTKVDNNMVVTYKDGSTDTLPLTKFARTNEAPTVEIPYSVDGKKDVYVYANEDFEIPIKFKDDSGKIASANVLRGGNNESPVKDASNPNVLNNEFNTTVEKISTETVATAENPAIVKIQGNISKDNSGILASSFPKEQDQELKIVTRYATATDTDGAYIFNTSTSNSYATDPGSFTIKLKAQTAKYDIKVPETKVPVVDANNVTEAEFNEIKKNIKIQYSAENPDKNLADKKGKEVENQDDRIESITKDGNNVVVTYKDGSKDKKPLSEFVTLDKQPAINEVNKAAEKQIEAINNNPEATKEEKDKAIEQVNADKAKALEDIANSTATTKPELDKVEKAGTDKIKTDNPVLSKKPAAKQAIDDALAAKNKAIDARPDLTPEEKTKAKEAAKAAADKAKEAVDAAKTNADVDTAAGKIGDELKKVNPVAKEAAKKAIADELAKKEKAIDARTDLTKEEKDAAKKEAQDKAKEATDAINKQPDIAETPEKATEAQTAVDGAKDKGVADVKAVNPVAAKKAEAKQAIDDALTAKNQEIDARTDLTPEEKTKAKEAAKAAADKAKEAVDAATTNAAVDKAKADGTTAVANVTPVAKAEAKKAINDALTAKNKEIDARTDLTDEEKTAAKNEAKDKADAQLAKINEQPDAATTPTAAKTAQDAVDAAKKTGVDEVTAVNPEAVKKPAAKKAIDDALKAKEAAIDARPDLTDDEKKAAKDVAKDAADKAKEAIDAAPSNAAVDAAKKTGVDKVAAVNPEAVKKPAAKKAIDDALKAKEAAIDARPDLTDDEKKAAKEAAKDAADKAKEAIDAAPSNAEVDKAKEAGTGEIAKVNPVAKEAAKKAVADELAKKEAEIDGRNDLTDEEKAKAKEEAQAKAKEATDAIDAQPSNAETSEKAAEAQTAVDGAKDKGVADVTAVNPEAKAKPEAKKAIEDKLAKQLEDIANTPDATDDEKKVAADAAKALADQAKKEIDKAGTDAEVKQLQDEAEKEIEKSVPVVEDKPNARKAIEDEAKAKKEAIDARTDLTPKAKEDLKAQVDAIADQAKKSVDAAKTSEAVDGIEESDKAAIKAVGEVNIPADKVLVNDPSTLTDDEKAKVLEAVKKVNPDAKEITQDADGNVTVTTPDGNKEIITLEQVVKTADTANDPKAGNDIVKPADKVVVNDPAKLTDAEKDKIKAAVEAVNPNSIVVVDDKGNAKVSTPEGQTQVIPVEELVRTVEDTKKPNAGNDIVKPADKTVVTNPEKLTDAEKKAIEDKVKAVNPGSKVVVDDKGNATVTTPEGKTAVIPAADLTKDPEAATKPNAGNDIVKPADKTAVKDPANLTPEEKKAIEDKVKAVNPGATVVVDDKGNATVTTPEGNTAVIPATDLTKSPADAAKANAGNTVNTPAAKVEVKDPAKLTDEEKAKVKEAIEAVNPGSKVVVDDKGNATVTTPEGDVVVIPSTDLTKSPEDAAKANAGNAVNTPAAKVEVKDPANLTDAEKKAIEDKVKAVNPGSTVVVDDKGNATVTTPAGKTAVIPATDLVKSPEDATKPNAGNDIVKPADKTVVANPDKLTDAEKKAIEDKVKAVNPGSTVVVDDKGNATVTTPEGKTAVIPASDLTKSAADAAKPNAGDDIVKPADKTVVANPDKLTDSEKKAIEDKVKAVNPGSTVVVDDKGNATVTTPGGKTAVIPATDLVKTQDDITKENAGNDVNTPAAKTVVANPDKLTDAEKKAIEDKVKAVNPGSTVVVDDKGNATVAKGDGTVLNIPALDLVIPADDLVDAAKNTAVKTPAIRTLVADKEKLTDAEKAAVKKAIEAVNPGATVVVDDKGNATVTLDGNTVSIAKDQLVKTASDVTAKNSGDNINLDFEKETVADFNNLTDAEKEAAKAKIKGANADVVEVIFDKAGNATVVTKDGKVLAIAAEDIFKQRPSAPNNGGNGTSGNNGTTSTDVKVDKAKLEGAIRQLDELIIKESAKLDAETAKEANDLLADAKKVFANADASQAEVDAMVKRIEDFIAKVAPSTDHATPTNDQAAQTPAVAPATTQAAANASQEAATNARKAAKELPNTGTADSTVAMVAAAASALLGLGLAGRRRKEDEEA